MIKYIKSEISYAKFGIIHTNWIFLLVILYAYAREFNPLNIFAFFAFILYAVYIIQNGSKENRIYKLSQLPIRNRDAAAARIILILLAFALVYSIAAILFIVFDFNSALFRGSIYELYSLGGLRLMSIFTYLIISDIFTVFRNRSGYVWSNIIVVTLISLAFIFTASSLRNAFEKSVDSGMAPLILLYVGVTSFIAISYITYQHRESYIEN